MRIILGLLLGLGTIVAMSYFCFLDKVGSIKDNILTDVKKEYQQRGFNWVNPKLKGEGIYSTRTLILEGTAPNSTQKEEAQKLALAQNDIFSVEDRITLESKTDKFKVADEQITEEKKIILENKAKSPDKNESVKKKTIAKLKITKDKNHHVVIEGLVDDIKTLNMISTRARQLFGKKNIDNQLTVGDNVLSLPKDDLLLAMDELAALDHGNMSFIDKNLTFAGYVSKSSKKDRLTEEFKKYLSEATIADFNISAPKATKPKIKIAKTTTIKPKENNQSLKPLKEELTKVESKVEKVEKKPLIKKVKTLSCQEKLTKLLSKNKIHFKYNSTKVQKSSYSTLEKLKTIIKECPSNKGFVIEGHTDSVGSDKYNLILSQKRADEIKNYLKLQGIKPSTIIAIGYGEKRPLVKNIDNKSKAKNRRIEIKVIDKDKIASIKKPKLNIKSKVATKKIEPTKTEAKKAKTKPSRDLGASYCQKKFDNLVNSHKIYFSLDKKSVSPHSKRILNSLAKIAKRCPNATIYIDAYTDSIGTKMDNLKLSKLKAHTIKRYLEKQGIKKSRMIARGFGENNPIADNSTAHGRSQNRRVEFKIKENR